MKIEYRKDDVVLQDYNLYIDGNLIPLNAIFKPVLITLMMVVGFNVGSWDADMKVANMIWNMHGIQINPNLYEICDPVLDKNWGLGNTITWNCSKVDKPGWQSWMEGYGMNTSIVSPS